MTFSTWPFVDEAEIRYEIGKEKGREEGIEQANMAIVRRMKEKGFSAQDIADMTGLSPEDINSL